MAHTFVVIPVHNRVEYTLACLQCLEAQTVRRSMTVIVVDDGSIDGTAAMVAEAFPGVQVLRGSGDLWWAGATNLGVIWALARCRPDDYVLTMNDDTQVSSHYVASLVSAASALPRSLIGSIAVDIEQPEHLIHWGTRIDWWFGGSRPIAQPRPPLRDSPIAKGRLVDVLPGRGMLIPVEVFADVGLFDAERLPQYAADYEFTRRARRAGYMLAVNWSSVVRSHADATGTDFAGQRLSLRAFMAGLISRRSYASLRYRWRYAHSCLAWPQAIFFYGTSTARVVGGGIRTQMFHRLAGHRIRTHSRS